MRKILAPHREQDRWVYIRVKNNGKWLHGLLSYPHYWNASGDLIPYICYDDSHPRSRTISSRRVERAVENDDFLKLCAEEGLHASFDAGVQDMEWGVTHNGGTAFGPTLREAYFRYKRQEASSDTPPLRHGE